MSQEGKVFDTNLVIVGNVLTAPEWRRTTGSGSLVTNFRIASTARRFDRESGRWVDGNSLRVRVTAWRRLAEGVASSIAVGDPIVVYGRLFCRDWRDEKLNNRVSYEMEALSIGHDLSRGRSRFFRARSAPVISEIESTDAETQVRGEASVPLTADEAPVVYGEGIPDQLAEDEPTFAEPPFVSATAASTAPATRPERNRPEADQPGPDRHEAGRAGTKPGDLDSAAQGEADPMDHVEPGSTAGSGGSPDQAGQSAPSEADDLTLEVERLAATGRRRGRTAKREPVAA